MKKILLASVVAIGLFVATNAYAAEPALVTIKNNGTQSSSFSPFTESPGTIGGVAAGDLGTDNVAEIVVGAGAGLPPLVAVFRQDGSKIGEFLAYAEDFRRGVNVAVCDTNGDGDNEIVTGAKFGGGPHVRVFDGMGNPIGPGFFAYADSFRGGVNVACADFDDDGAAEIITGAGATGGPHIKAFDYSGRLLAEIFNGSAVENVGVHVAVENGIILAADIAGDDATVSSYAFEREGLTAIANVTNQTRDSIITTDVVDSQTSVTAEIQSELFRDTSARYILVDISEQRLYAYEYGMQANSFLISSGTYGYDTPYGKFSVLAKVPVVDYIGVDYAYPNTPWNLRFKPHYYIHTAYWHNNFGHRMSHGCVNMRENEAKWMYDWADVNTTVEIVP